MKKTGPNKTILHLPALTLIAIFCGSPMQAQQSSMINVLHADSLQGKTVNNISFQELMGHVRINQDKVYISCDHAMKNITDNIVELHGNVVITQDTLVLKTANGVYNGNTKTAFSSGGGVFLNDGHVTLVADVGRYETSVKVAHFVSRVQVLESTSSLKADTLRYERENSKAIASGNVRMEFTGENALITGDSAIHFVKKKISIFPRRPILWQVDSVIVKKDSLSGKIDSLRLDTLSIVSKHMEAHRDSTNFYLSEGDVEIVRRDMSARCGKAEFFRNDSLVILQKKPILWYDLNQLTGDSITVYLANNKLDTLAVDGNAFSLSQSKAAEKDTVFPAGRYDQIKGKHIRLAFKNNKANRIRVDKTAISLYYLYDSRALNGVRKESGDLILIDFVDGKVDRIHSLGGVEGTYFPEKFVTDKESSYNLDGFLLRNDKPVQPVMPVKESNPKGKPTR